LINITPEALVKTLQAQRTTESKRNSQKSINGNAADAAWQPWFLPKEVSQRVIRLIPPGYRKRFRFCFNDFGCFRCGRKDIPFRSLGFCENCHNQITTWMRRSMKRHQRELRGNRSTPRIRWYMEQVNRAEELLADFVPPKHRSRRPSN
jgi:hypothetical protein